MYSWGIREAEGLVERLGTLDFSATDRSEDTTRPSSIGPYEILEPLGEGGMGRVFVARQHTPSRRVAIKIIRHGIASADALRRFLLESEMLARVSHPGIAQVYDAGLATDEQSGIDHPYIVMELVPDARSIRSYADHHGLDLRGRVSLVGEVCQAIAHAHSRGIVHRDIKPGNILVSGDGHPKLIDFGIARASHDSSIAMTLPATQPGQLLGTIQYMSPEQVEAVGETIDPRTDVYSLGLVLYELVTGESPIAAAGLPLAIALNLVRRADIKPPSEHNRHVRGDLEAIILKATRRDPADRYQTAAAFAEDLGRYLRREPVTARPPNAISRLIRWAARHPIAATAAACGLLVVVSVPLAVVFTTIAVAWYNTRVHDIVLQQDRGIVSLVARSGRVLDHEWTGVIPWQTTPFATRVHDGKSDRNALIAFTDQADRWSHSAALFGFHRPETPIWTSDITMAIDTVPDYIESDILPDTAQVRCMLSADIFEQFPGDEIVIADQNRQSLPSRLRIYARHLPGDPPDHIVYQLWHPGWIEDMEWRDDRLVILACNNRPVWADIDTIDHRIPYVPACFAVRPQAGLIQTDWITRIDSPPDVLWYLALPTWPGTSEVCPGTLSTALHDENMMRISIQSWCQSTGLMGLSTWDLTAGGQTSISSVMDEYFRTELPDPRHAEYGPWLFQHVDLPWYEEKPPAESKSASGVRSPPPPALTEQR